MSSEDFAYAAIPELGASLRRGEVSAVELAKLFLDRLDTLGRELNAVVSLTESSALAAAEAADAELRAGIDRGPLHGIPFGLKDIVAAAGAPTTWGAAPFREQHIDADATVTTRLRTAGAVLVAKLATIEIAGGMGYDNPDATFTGPTANPWDRATWTSGSSSGPAAAVAAGLVPFAIGSDTSGSILLPAAWTGTAGLRATYGRVSRAGAMALCWTLDRLGPFAHTAHDCGLVLEAIAGPDPLDPSTLGDTYTYSGRTPRRYGFRFGVIEGAADGAATGIGENFEESLRQLGQLGTLEPVTLPAFPYDAVQEVITGAEAFAAFDQFLAAGQSAELTAEKARIHRFAGALLPAHDYIRAQRIRRQLSDAVDTLLSQFDAVVAPTIGTYASGIADDFEYMLPSAFPHPLNFAGVLTGSPTLSIGNGFGPGGLPTSIQFAGARRGENALLDAATALERSVTTPGRRPPVGAMNGGRR